MPSKKVILFIVEGITDEISIGSIITKLNKKEKIYFQIVNKDITSYFGNDSSNIINKIPYEVFFFSTNLEYVLHNIQNAKDEDKLKLAEKFEDKFYENPQNFIEFINDSEYALNDTYNATWNFIKKSNNSLKRYTNFNLFFHNNN